MRYLAALACALVTLDCASKAVGASPQELLNPDHIWAWWVVAGAWAINTVVVATRGAP
jgi:hypothetical protein